MKQLELELQEAAPSTFYRCDCGAELRSHIEDYRGLCDRCILRKTIGGHVWSEDPEAKRAHYFRWLQRRGISTTPPTESDPR